MSAFKQPGRERIIPSLAFGFYSGPPQTGGCSPRPGSVICFISLASQMLISSGNNLTDMPRRVSPNIRGPCGAGKLTEKISRHSNLVIRPTTSSVLFSLLAFYIFEGLIFIHSFIHSLISLYYAPPLLAPCQVMKKNLKMQHGILTTNK